MTRRPIRPAEVVLGLIDPADQPEVERLLAEDPLFRDEVERLRATSTVLHELEREAWRPETPPPLVPAPAPVLDAAPPAGGRSRWRPHWRLIGPVAGLAAAAAAVVFVVAPGEDPQPGRRIALRALGDVPGAASLTVRGNDAELRGEGMPPSGQNDYYEAWLADDRGHMVSMGTFRVDRDGRVNAHMAIAVDLARYDLVDVSLEPDDGNPAHSDTSVMRARL